MGANPEVSAEDVANGGTDQVRAALRLARLARRAILVIPLFAGADYEGLIAELGGRIVFRAEAARGPSSLTDSGKKAVWGNT